MCGEIEGNYIVVGTNGWGAVKYHICIKTKTRDMTMCFEAGYNDSSKMPNDKTPEMIEEEGKKMTAYYRRIWKA